jgi:hypothetical protein
VATTSRRIRSAQARGFVKNLNAGKRGTRARYITDEALPADVVVLPEASEIPAWACSGSQEDYEAYYQRKRMQEENTTYPESADTTLPTSTATDEDEEWQEFEEDLF